MNLNQIMHKHQLNEEYILRCILSDLELSMYELEPEYQNPQLEKDVREALAKLCCGTKQDFI